MQTRIILGNGAPIAAQLPLLRYSRYRLTFLEAPTKKAELLEAERAKDEVRDIQTLMDYVGDAFDKQQMDINQDAITMDLRITQLRSQIRINVDKIKMVSSETTIKYLEEDITKLEAEIAELTLERQTKEQQKPTDMEKVKAYVRYFLEHLEELLLGHGNAELQAKYFGVIFNEAPTYEDIVSGTPDCSKITGVNEVFKAKKSLTGLMAGARGHIPNF